MMERSPAAAIVETGQIDATPTKRFFIDMITRDIELSEAIADLVDNSVDAARALGRDADLSGRKVALVIAKDSFVIEDNCGGMSKATAKDYAFKFGRPTSLPVSDHSIGRFGVGMKRAIFKIGSQFVVESRTHDESFTISVDVEEWEKKEKWTFDFETEGPPTESRLAEPGLRIAISRIHTSVASDFSIEATRSSLRSSLAAAHQLSIESGLEITINGVTLPTTDRSLLYSSSQIVPAYWKDEISDVSQPNLPGVQVQLIAGLLPGRPAGRSGWDIFCNGRLVVQADRTSKSGWGSRKGVPAFHPQYNQFKGFAFFEASDPIALPWTTTKNDVDLDSPVYRTALEQMRTMMLPVLQFLNALDSEKELTEQPLTQAVRNSEATTLRVLLDNAELEEVFRSPPPAARSTKRLARITYTRNREMVEKVKAELHADSFKEVGERTFGYFLENELGLDEGDFADA